MDEISFDGRAVPVEQDQTVAAALWQAGVRAWRTTRVAGAPRGLFCGIGACHDCLTTVDGSTGERACVTPARPGTVVSTTATGPGPARVPRQRIGRFDVAVVGAGPAGLAAAATAALGGGRVALVDSGSQLGGQYWRHRPGATGGRDWAVYRGLESIVEERVEYVPEATVWFAEPEFVLHTTAGPVEADRIIIATGAYDRALPFPGWDLPGVVTPGGAQALLKGSGVVVGHEVVVAGAGPFLLPVAVGLAEAGARVVAVVEAGQPTAYLRQPSKLVGAAGKLGEAAAYATALARRRIPYLVGHAVVAANGGADGVSSVDIMKLRDGSRRTVACDAVAVGYGFTANLELALLLGCGTRRAADGGLAVVVDGDGQTTVPGVYAAGEVTGVGGATLAVAEGEIAGSAAAGWVLSTRELSQLRSRRDRLRRFADAMHAAHAVGPGWMSWLDDRTVVCRCEEVPLGQIRRAVRELGATDARTVKLLARPGMGWCQGRVCGYPTAELTAHLCGRASTEADLAAFAHRPLAAAVRLSDLAGT
jgi:NADPH-dependent 2,4-dienoyl-CoA reductase/sulfur reductase-like enzyme